MNAGAIESETAAAAAQDPAATRALVQPLYAGKELRTGESFAAHADGIAAIVATLRPDPDLIVAAQLFGVYDVLREPEEWLRARFGAAIAQLVADLRQLMRLSELTRAREEARGRGNPADQAEALRRMLLAMANDLRVVLLRLASRLQTLRYYALSKRPGAEPIARETLDLYAPLANRLGIWQLKWELEDLSFRFLEPETYKSVARLLDEKRSERESFIEEALVRLRALVAEAGLRAEITGRPKHIFSIWNKMRTKGYAFEQVYDVRGLRVIVDEVPQCYQVLALVHSTWTPVESEYDDYIARPKPNGYQSLHTVVGDDAGRTLEVQIRTRRMHEHAELGVAAHWKYKEGGKGRDDEQRVAWLRQLLAWRAEVDAPPASGPVREERIYVLTPQARVVELPAGGTPIDFAYHIHSELGHRCRGARVDGVMVPLNTPLATGQTVEIMSAKTGGPSRDWLNAELGYLQSARSKAKVRQWFNALEFEQAVTAGREIVQKELQRLGRTATKLDDLAHRLGFDTVDDLCAAATKEEFSIRSIEQALAPSPQPEEVTPHLPAGKPHEAPAGRGKVLVVGVDSLLTQLARCCRPAPPDEIGGYVTRGRGVSIHRANCSNLQALIQRQPERVVEVAWGRQADAVYPVEMLIIAQDRQGLLRDISEIFSREKINVIGVSTQSQRGEARMGFTAEVRNAGDIARVGALLREVNGVIAVRRR
ncbi:MAG TPA: bifunctional (p)ppGpp synthetase/guanosine-3',5'-bis(diphosphate) 3'-pyrophosphohydrolase [Burkholderiaceae bacterium]|nr:bifunctional (p)ppGpp synthetase/guanosine-3',5'-bis(diphosphate) 3'-pyrophosphohydrolase [Burkholderiaceae bacterium]HQR69140.1 bifunctional (p)ppGpp synthetase/guanosine-3',5'-bis(diphosphate) 3'-pyrophosphohydrolase [Burkholderiaceae bacterium]